MALHGGVLVGPTTRTLVMGDVTFTLTSPWKLEVDAKRLPVAVDEMAEFVMSTICRLLIAECPRDIPPCSDGAYGGRQRSRWPAGLRDQGEKG